MGWLEFLIGGGIITALGNIIATSISISSSNKARKKSQQLQQSIDKNVYQFHTLYSERLNAIKDLYKEVVQIELYLDIVINKFQTGDRGYEMKCSIKQEKQ